MDVSVDFVADPATGIAHSGYHGLIQIWKIEGTILKNRDWSSKTEFIGEDQSQRGIAD
jgi:hypothetical protein